jgi:serine/threonine protein kinase
MIGNFSKAEHHSHDLSQKRRRTLDHLSPHTAPELLPSHSDCAIDVWALGMVVYELQVGKVRISPYPSQFERIINESQMNTENPITLQELKNNMMLSNATPELLHLMFEVSGHPCIFSIYLLINAPPVFPCRGCPTKGNCRRDLQSPDFERSVSTYSAFESPNLTFVSSRWDPGKPRTIICYCMS